MSRHLHPLLLPAALFGLWAGLVPAFGSESMPEQIRLDDQALNRIEHQTVRYLGMFRVYTLGVYAAGAEPLDALLASPRTKCIEAVYHRDVQRDLLAEAANRILANQHPPSLLEGYAGMLEKLHGHYVDVETGDRYRLCHIEGEGLRLTHNGGNALRLADDGFARLYLGIWLGPGGILEGLS